MSENRLKVGVLEGGGSVSGKYKVTFSEVIEHKKNTKNMYTQN